MEKVDNANLDAEDTASPYDSFDWLGGPKPSCVSTDRADSNWAGS
jgi:hypothetical protein